eukprot:12634242-Alexandrium_andersonii.AAC.1
MARYINPGSVPSSDDELDCYTDYTSMCQARLNRSLVEAGLVPDSDEEAKLAGAFCDSPTLTQEPARGSTAGSAGVPTGT